MANIQAEDYCREFVLKSVYQDKTLAMKNHIYIHYPYCLYKCHYCDFNSYAWTQSDIPQSRYTEALLGEMRRRRNLFETTGTHFYAPNTEIDSIFFGGGTPSLMNPQDLELVLAAIHKEFTLPADCEITLECNPGTINREKLRAFKMAGINRLSLGVQSFAEENLKTFGRIHSGAEAIAAIDAALESGIERVSADLIFGFPNQTLAGWQRDLETILKKGLTHLSCYALTAEPDTIYTKALSNGDYAENNPEIFADMMEFTYKRMAEAGLPAYEISNFARPGFESRHNLGYWRYESYIGLGAGATGNYYLSNDSGFVARTKNTKSPEPYMRGVAEGDFFETEAISRQSAMGEFMLMGLRLKEGISRTDFSHRFGCEIESVYGAALQEAVTRGWILFKDDLIVPTSQAVLFNNSLSLLFV